MKQQDIYTARLADRSVLPNLVCGHCNSMISKTRVFVNKGRADVPGQILAYCTADDCCAINSCDEALSKLEESSAVEAVAS